MLFIRYENFREYIKFYPVNTIILFLIIAAHVAVYITSLITGLQGDMVKVLFGIFINQPPYNQLPNLWRYIASIFLHGNIPHLLFNAFAIFVFAPPLERLVGKFRYAVLFLFAGIMGNVFTNFYPDTVFSLGASGAVYGVFGAYLYLSVFHRRLMDEGSRKTLFSMLIVGVIYSVVVPGINFYAHLGGFLGGFMFLALYIQFLRGRKA